MGFAEGLSNGVNLGLRLVAAKESSDRNKKIDDRQDKQWADEDAQKDAVKRANEAAMTAYQDWSQAGNQTPSLPEAKPSEPPAQPDLSPKGGMTLGGGVSTDGKLTLGGGAPSFGQPADVTAKPTAEQQAPQPQPLTLSTQAPSDAQRPAQRDEREGILAGMQARRKALMNEKVDPKLWMDDWGKEANLRAQIRGEKIDGAEKRFLATGDPGEYARTVYPLIDDGMDFVGSRQVKDGKGNMAWEFVRRDQKTGKEVSNVMNADQFQRFMIGTRDPNAVVQYEAKSMLERMKADQKIREEAAKQDGERETNRQKSTLTLGEIAARSRGEMAVTKQKGKEDRGTNASKPIVLGPDASLVKPDSLGQYQEVAKGNPRTPINAANPSAPNRILSLRKEAADAIAKGADEASVRAEFKRLTGKAF